MRWSRFALGLLPALPVVVVAVYVAVAGGPEPSRADALEASARPTSDSPMPRGRSTVRRRPRPRTADSSRPLTAPKAAPSSATEGAEEGGDSPLAECCTQLERYSRTTSHKWRALYSQLATLCGTFASSPDEQAQTDGLDKLREEIKKQKGPYTPPACR